MKASKILILAAIIAMALHTNAQTTQRFSATKANDYAIVYTLPTTQLVVTLEAEVTVEKPGDFYKYAKKYLNIDDPITAEKRSATLKSVVVAQRGVPNVNERYSVQFKGGVMPFMLLTENNLPLAINTENVALPHPPELPQALPASKTPLDTPAARQVVSEEMMQSQSTAKRAELAAQALFAIRQTRSELITGQADQMPPDGQSLQLMLDNLEAQEEALLAMFVGTKSTRTDVSTFAITPDGNLENKVIARISALDGIVDATDLSGAPVYLNVRVTSRGQMPVNDKGQVLPFPKGGLAYCIPGEATVSVNYDGKQYYDTPMPFAQFGVVYGLAPNSFTDRKAPLAVTFSPATGALLTQQTAN